MKATKLIGCISMLLSTAAAQPHSVADTLVIHVTGGFGTSGNSSSLRWLKSNGTYQTLSGDFPALVEVVSEIGFPIPSASRGDVQPYTYDPSTGVLTFQNTSIFTFLTDTRAQGFQLSSVFLVGRKSENPRQNISLRGRVEVGKPLIVGVSLTGDQWALIRIVGPTLTSFGVPGTCPRPIARLYAEQRALYVIPKWGKDVRGISLTDGSAEMRELFKVLGAFPLSEGSNDCAVLSRLYGKNAHSVVTSVDNEADAGEVLIEVYYLPFEFTGQPL